MSRWLQSLNAEQREAVRCIEGPLLVLAGAGSGKTRVITHRIAHMMDQGIAPESILAVTFTNKAAEEMRQRLAQMVGSSRAARVTLSTFHSFGLELLKAEAARKRRRSRFTIFDTGDQLACLREITRRLNLERSFDLGSILSRISAYKNAFVAPEDLQPGDDPYDQAAAELYPRYVELLEAYAAVDFDDLVCRPTQLMEQSAACRKRWTDRFRYVLVDEYQDTNTAQLRMLQALAGQHRNLCVVGDDDQAIYGWRGADVRNILQFERHFPGAKIVYLLSNYRSVPSVLQVANDVIAQNAERHQKVLRPTRGQGAPVRIVVAPDGDAEAAWVARYIRDAVRGGRFRWGDVAVLYRSNITARGLELSLREQGIPYRVLGGAAFFERKEVKDVVAYLRLCAHLGDELSLRRAINTPARGIGPRTIARLAQWAEQHDRSLWAALEQSDAILGATDRAAGTVAAFRAMMLRHAAHLRRGGSPAEMARRLVDEVGLRQDLERGSTSTKIFERRWGNVVAFLHALDSYCQRAAKPSLREFLNRIALASADDDLAEGADARATLCTLHGSKGLEFPLVLLVGLEEGLLPHDRTLNPHQNDHVTSDIAEERRLCYVGVTRARDELILTRACERMVRGRMQVRPPSRFLEDIAPEHLEVEDLAAPPPMEQVRSMMAELRARFAGD